MTIPLRPAESRAIYRAASKWGVAGIKWRNRASQWVGSGALDVKSSAAQNMDDTSQELVIRALLGMEGAGHERR